MPPTDPRAARNAKKKEPELPEMTKARDHDRAWHIERGLEHGLTREEAERHADEHLGERARDDARE